MIALGLLHISSVSTDCPNIINLARGLGVQSSQPSIWNNLQLDCCTESGITCTSQRVTHIQWIGLALNGSINGTALPSTLTLLWLRNNQLTGKIPPLLPIGLYQLDLNSNLLTGSIPAQLPSGITGLFLHGNLLTGSIPSTLPTGLTSLDLYGNRLSGDIPQLPSTLRNLYLGWPGKPGNQLTGAVSVNRPIHFVINDNWITDVIIQDVSQISSSYCHLDNNPLLGNINIAQLTMCTKNGIYNSSLLPNTATTSISGSTTRKSSQHFSMEIASELISTFELSTSLEALVTSIPKDTTIADIMTPSHAPTLTLSIIFESTFPINSTGTVPFQQLAIRFNTSLNMTFRLIISAMILTGVFLKTPFSRECKRIRNKKISKELKSSDGV